PATATRRSASSASSTTHNTARPSCSKNERSPAGTSVVALAGIGGVACHRYLRAAQFTEGVAEFLFALRVRELVIGNRQEKAEHDGHRAGANQPAHPLLLHFRIVLHIAVRLFDTPSI